MMFKIREEFVIMQDNKPTDESTRRKFTIGLFSVAGIVSVPTTWTTPIINSVMLPAHAQTSCTSILDVDVLGVWRFTSVDNVQFDIEFVDDTNLSVNGGPPGSGIWSRGMDGVLILSVSHRAPLRTIITNENGCVASRLEIQNSTQFFIDFVPPAIGFRL